MEIQPNIRAIVFDAFGTLVQIGEAKHPYRQLMKLFHAAGRKPQADDAHRIMSSNVELAEMPSIFGVVVPKTEIIRLTQLIEEELKTITLYPDTVSTLERLKAGGYELGICSNLAKPYARPILELLPFELDVYAWSFEVGTTKPHPEIYAYVCDSLKLPPQQIGFIGDMKTADVEGPRAFGMLASYLNREAGQSLEDALSMLA